MAAWLVAGETVLVGNLGDAKAVLARESLPTVKNKGISQCTASTGVPSPPRALVLTKDHLCLVPTERARIQRAGGSISADGRLNGRLQVRFWCGSMAPTLPKSLLLSPALSTASLVTFWCAAQVSRGFGDAAFKGCGACAVPDVVAFALTPRDRFLLLACDGFWSVRRWHARRVDAATTTAAPVADHDQYDL